MKEKDSEPEQAVTKAASKKKRSKKGKRDRAIHAAVEAAAAKSVSILFRVLICDCTGPRRCLPERSPLALLPRRRQARAHTLCCLCCVTCCLRCPSTVSCGCSTHSHGLFSYAFV